MTASGSITIGGAGRGCGDGPNALAQLLGAGVDYAMIDALTESSIFALTQARVADGKSGFVTEFLSDLVPLLPLLARCRSRIVTNAGGANPYSCKFYLEAAIAAAGLSLKVACVQGDNAMELIPALRQHDLRDALTGAPAPDELASANVYLGAVPIKAALDAGADLVITGRCADSALALGILMHEFGWAIDDYDRLSAGSLVGHILECGPQATGGAYTDWQRVPDLHKIGLPIAQCFPDGSFVVRKPAGTGGLIEPGVIAEQALFAIGDPTTYLLPDVAADFSQIRLRQVGPNAVHVEGARGRAPTHTYKGIATYQDGYRAVFAVAIIGIDAAAKAEHTGRSLVERGRNLLQEKGFGDFSAVLTEPLGAEASYGVRSAARRAREVLLRVAVEHRDVDALRLLLRELKSVGLLIAPGSAAIFVVEPQPVVRLFSFLLDKRALAPPRLRVGSSPLVEVEVPMDGGFWPSAAIDDAADEADPIPSGPTVGLPLAHLAYARSGARGNATNVAIIAREPRFFPLLRREVTSARIINQLRPLIRGPAARYEVPGLHALNFWLESALACTAGTLGADPRGRAYGQMALEMQVDVPCSWAFELVGLRASGASC